MAPERASLNGPWVFGRSTNTREYLRGSPSARQPFSMRRLEGLEARLEAWLSAHSITITRVALGVVFLWFGLLKFLPEPSVTADLAGRTIHVLSLGVVPSHVAIPVVAAWECIIGVGLLNAGTCA